MTAARKTARALTTIAGCTAVAIGTVGMGADPAAAEDTAQQATTEISIDQDMTAFSSESPGNSALINGPLVQGPLLDFGGVLNSPQTGQFQ